MMTTVPHLVLLCGPPFVGKTEYYRKFYSNTHARLCPEEIFERDPSSGLRDVILQAVHILLKGGNVVVDDENWRKECRDSYLRVVKKKVPTCRITVVKLSPKYGYTQLSWSRQFRMASLAEKSLQQKLSLVSSKAVDTKMEKWFPDNDRSKVVFNLDVCHGKGVDVVDKETSLTAYSNFKFELPALFIGCDSLESSQADVWLEKVAEVCSHWYSATPCGRVLFVASGDHSVPGAHTEEVQNLKDCLKALANKLGFPVYAVHLENPSLTCEFMTPPKPGVLAYLQRRHHLDLSSQCTMYLYESPFHKTMAGNMGLANCKLSKISVKPTMVTAGRISYKYYGPEMLRTIELKEEGGQGGPHTPMSDLVDETTANHVSASLGGGWREYLFFRDHHTLNQYKLKYESHATSLMEEESRVTKMCHIPTQCSSTLMTAPSPKRETPSTKRETPSWMQSDSPKLGNKALLSARKRTYRTKYIMTERELVDTATLIISQTGGCSELDESHPPRHDNGDKAGLTPEDNPIHTEERFTEAGQPPSDGKITTYPQTKRGDSREDGPGSSGEAASGKKKKSTREMPSHLSILDQIFS